MTFYKAISGEVYDFNFAPSPAKDWTKLSNAAGKRERAAYSAAELRKIVQPGQTVYTILRNVARSGMSRRLSVVIQGKTDTGECYVRDITYLVIDACGFTRRGDYLSVSGCGMDMGFAVVYDLSSTLYRDNFICTGKGCRSNDHTNGDRNYKPHKHSDGGYALSQSWL